MKKISVWAKRHLWAARISIPFIYAAIAALAIVMARNLQALQIQMSGVFFSLSIVSFFAGVIFYPDKKNFRIGFYYRQKICDFLLVFSSFLVVGCVATDPAKFLLLPESSRAASLASLPGDPVPVKPAVSNNKKPVFKFAQTRAERRALLKQVKAMLRQSLHKGEKDPNSATRITLVILSIIGGVVLSMLLIALACNIACTGSGSLALFVAFFGAAAIAALLVLAIRGIYHRYPTIQRFKSRDGRRRPALNKEMEY